MRRQLIGRLVHIVEGGFVVERVRVRHRVRLNPMHHSLFCMVNWTAQKMLFHGCGNVVLGHIVGVYCRVVSQFVVFGVLRFGIVVTSRGLSVVVIVDIAQVIHCNVSVIGVGMMVNHRVEVCRIFDNLGRVVVPGVHFVGWLVMVVHFVLG